MNTQKIITLIGSLLYFLVTWFLGMELCSGGDVEVKFLLGIPLKLLIAIFFGFGIDYQKGKRPHLIFVVVEAITDYFVISIGVEKMVWPENSYRMIDIAGLWILAVFIGLNIGYYLRKRKIPFSKIQ